MSYSETDYDLLSFTIPPKHKPGTDLMSKAILEDKRVINLIVSRVIGDHAKDQYMSRSGEWVDGLRVDILYTPIMSL
ncbi:hypothetical protein INT47_008709 [Mucor saturninus]|nr:hypothetical protein INT47_008709 [Mucor saturninus]